MKRTLTATLAIILVLTSSVSARQQRASPAAAVPQQAAAWQHRSPPHRFVADELIVRFKKLTSEASIAGVHAQAGAKEMRRFCQRGGSYTGQAHAWHVVASCTRTVSQEH
jgi:hypothetical protein